VWDAGKGRLLFELPGHAKGVADAAFSPDGKLIATGGVAEDRTVRIWDAAGGKLRHRLEGQGSGVNHLAFSPDGKFLASGETCADQRRPRDGWVQLWNPHDGTIVRVLPAPPGSVLSLQFSPDGRTLAVTGRGVQFCAVTPSGRKTFFAADEDHVLSLGYSPDGRTAILQTMDGLLFYDTAARAEIHRLGGKASGQRAAVSPDGRVVAVGQDRGKVRLISAVTFQDLLTLEGHPKAVGPLAFSPDGRRLVTGSDDTTALVWDVAGIGGKAVPSVKEATPGQLAKWWDELANPNAKLAYRATWDLIATPEQAVALLREKLKPAADDTSTAKLITALDSTRFADRESAAKQLAAPGRDAESELRKALDGSPSAETHRRIEGLLERLEKEPPSPERLREGRALTVLEQAGGPAARKLLAELAGGASGAQLTRDAKSALDRIDRRSER
jgi:WD40 repeat protein